MGEFRMPSLGADMETGTLVEWLVAPGTLVRRGDIIATVETQKGLFEIEIFEEGILGEPLIQAGQEVPVGTVLALIHAANGSAVKKDAVSDQPKSAPERFICSPSARRLAREMGVDLATIHGTGPKGAIQRIDIEHAAQTRIPPAVESAKHARTEPASHETLRQGMRQAIAAAMSRSNSEIPHYYLEMEIDMSRSLQWLEVENQKRTIRERLLPAVLLLKAVAKALRDIPEFNGYWLDNQLQIKTEIHIGFAVALRQGGLITPAIHAVDSLSLTALMKAMSDLIERTRSGRLRSSEMTDATVTVTNLGDQGVRTVFGVIYPPQVALIAFGRITERPWAEGGMLGIRRCVTATLAADHRATDGHRGSQFLEVLNKHLQQPESL
ncbi:dihydrolipoamide acetyltransferase family protein [Desulfopila aestuarii]|uniref:Dihydrolipoamide acetyltransferase component of pyruvate dehydrogenase complex n=1 Tax=Desulfopila aestuarii DSM 18488 TaxID=1121416 RepID=A0A1M7YJG6_9BACT|nr:dihydrolipoamide acetyltransferase family protein [Desulfopila aestuarii]SHO52754.1 pyruvate dehydrogenase E2 component (dihydrolipoamide acetyltransferase) [Desulfopila aestuarii DSM 18488]